MARKHLGNIKGPKGDKGDTPEVMFTLDSDGNLYYEIL